MQRHVLSALALQLTKHNRHAVFLRQTAQLLVEERP
jgi:hypothetical protein